MEVSKYNIYIDNEYIFNLQKQSILRVDSILLNNIKNNTLEQADSHILSLLEKYGIINDDKNFFEKAIRNLNTTMAFFLSTTSECNFECTYCYESSRKKMEQNSYIDVQQWEDLKSYILETCKNNNINNIAIVLYGGEPLINIGLVKKIISDKDHFRRNGISVNYSIITNGSLLDYDLHECFEYLDLCQVTFDGYAEIHNSYRYYPNGEPSFEIIYGNVLNFSRIHKNKITIRINVGIIDNEYFTLIDRLAEANLQQDLKSLSFNPIFDDQNCCNPNLDNNLENEVMVSFIDDLKLYAAKRGFQVVNSFGIGPCIYLSKFAGCIDENLNLYHCPGLLYHSSYGRINRAETTKNDRNDNIKISKSCYKSCKYGPICFGGCYWKNKEQDGCYNFNYYEKYLIDHVKNHIKMKRENVK